MPTEGLQLEQAPPLRIPSAFFLTAPVAIAAAGVLVAVTGRGIFVSPWAPETLALAHLGTLGFLAVVMMGAFYQVTPVIAGTPVPRVGLAHAVHAIFVVALGLLVLGLYSHRPWAVFGAIGLLLPALLLFIIPVAVALGRAPTRSATVNGMRLALVSLVLTGVLGLWMAHGHSAMRFPGPRPLWIQVHLGVALLGWVGGLISAVSWQTMPMFYLAAPVGQAARQATLIGVATGVLLPVVVLGLDYAGIRGAGWTAPDRLAALGALPAILSVWGLQPALTWAGLRKRRRRRFDASLLFWQLGLLLAPTTAAAAAAAYLLADPRWDLLFGWLAIWGWAGSIVRGMLCRIVPFLVWFHRFSRLVGHVPVPSLRQLLPESTIRLGFALHLATLLLGAAAILSPYVQPADWLARATGLLLVASALQFGASLVRVLRQHPALQPPHPSHPDQRLRPAARGWLHVETRLRHLALITYALEKERLAEHIPTDRFEIPEFQIGGAPKALLSIVPLVAEDFHFSRLLPGLRVTFAQTDHRAYVIDRRTGEHVVWFFGTTLGSPLVNVPRLLWRLPWHRARYEIECDFDPRAGRYERYRFKIDSAWCGGEIDLEDTGEPARSLEGFDDEDAMKLILTDPIQGFFRRRDGKLGSYAVRHDPMSVTLGRARTVSLDFYPREGLLSAEELAHPHSVLMCPEVRFTIPVPPRIA